MLSFLCSKNNSELTHFSVFERKKYIFNFFSMGLHLGLNNLSNYTNIVIFGSKLTTKLGITIQHRANGRSIQHGRGKERGLKNKQIIKTSQSSRARCLITAVVCNLSCSSPSVIFLSHFLEVPRIILTWMYYFYQLRTTGLQRQWRNVHFIQLNRTFQFGLFNAENCQNIYRFKFLFVHSFSSNFYLLIWS